VKLFSRAVWGWVLIGIGAFLAIGVFANLDGRGWEPADTPMWWTLVFLPIAVGIFLISSRYLQKLSERQNQLEDDGS
jgi:hypothetical protein